MLALVVCIDRDRFAVDSRGVQTVLPRVALQSLPGSPPSFAGVFLYRGVVTPVVDVGRLLGVAPASGLMRNRVLMVEAAGPGSAPVGLLVEAVLEAKRIDERQAPAGASPAAAAAHVERVLLDEQGMLPMLAWQPLARAALEARAA